MAEVVDDANRNRLFRRFSQVTLAVVGESLDHEVIQPVGSAFFIAPYTAMTAAHVVNALWDELRAPWERGRYPRKPVDRAFYAILAQIPDPDRHDEVAQWQATSAPTSAFGDVAFLNLVPTNDIAERLIWPQFPELELLPPAIGERLAVYGFPEVSREEIREGVTKISARSKLSTGVVTDILTEGRGSWRFPQFETDALIAHGMSGGPVLHDGKVCGVASYAASYEGEPGPSYIAALWPALLTAPVKTSVDPRESIPLLNMLETGSIRSPGWRSILQRTAVIEDNEGSKAVILRRVAG
jgi:hypothetical protein